MERNRGNTLDRLLRMLSGNVGYPGQVCSRGLVACSCGLAKRFRPQHHWVEVRSASAAGADSPQHPSRSSRRRRRRHFVHVADYNLGKMHIILTVCGAPRW